jgi:hypothetical protein
MRFTLCAQSKLLTNFDWRKCLKIGSLENVNEGDQVDLITLAQDDGTLCTICKVPKVLVEKEVLSKHKDSVIDYDFETDNFIFSH